MVSRAWKSAAIAAAIAILAVLLMLRHEAGEPAPDASQQKIEHEHTDDHDHDHARTFIAPAPAPATATATPPRTPRPTNLEPTEAIDPCQPVEELEVPHGFERLDVNGITVAWQKDPKPLPSDNPLRPMLLAHAVAGALDEAAELTGTAPRSRLLVVVYNDMKDMHDATGAPAWAGGAYDGAVRLARNSAIELGVRLGALRHEVMHAQLHQAIGCMPTWLNEGLATYFSSEMALGGLFAMLRDRDLLDLHVLEARTFAGLAKDAATRAYWQAVAMVMYGIDHSDGATVAALVRRFGAVGAADPERLAAWEKLYPGVDQSAVLDGVAKRVFGTTSGVDALLRGPLCCWSVRDFSELGCRAPAVHEDREYWLDRTKAPVAACRSNW